MNYFQLFDLSENLLVDKSYNLKKYYELNRKFHPDNFSLDETEKQEEALQRSAQINAAKKVLDDSFLRLHYILKSHDILIDDEKYNLPPQFLGNMMEINEGIMELQLDMEEEKKKQLLSTIKNLEIELQEPVKDYFNAENLEFSASDFLKLKEFYYKMKYVQRIRENLNSLH